MVQLVDDPFQRLQPLGWLGDGARLRKQARRTWRHSCCTSFRCPARLIIPPARAGRTGRWGWCQKKIRQSPAIHDKTIKAVLKKNALSVPGEEAGSGLAAQQHSAPPISFL